MPFQLHHGDCLEVLRGMADNSIDSIVTDPPYGLSDHKPAELLACLTAWIAGEPYQPKGKGFMGKSWDAWVPGPEVWRECLRVLKPGGHLLAFAGTRSMDLMGMAVRLAGFELRDGIGYANDGGGAPLLAWCFGSGFPKSLDVSRAIDKANGHWRGKAGAFVSGNGAMSGANYMRQANGDPVTAAAWQGFGTALKPAWEPIILARKPLGEKTVAANVLAHGTGALNIDGCRVGTSKEVPGSPASTNRGVGESWGFGPKDGANSGANPNIGRWPANLIHDGSDEVLAGFPESGNNWRASKGSGLGYGSGSEDARCAAGHGDTGSAARFFYCAKASKRDREDGVAGVAGVAGGMRGRQDGSMGSVTMRKNIHPTVKPTDLMTYLCRLVTPPGGVVLDPFLGSGSTGKAAMREGFRFVGIEREAEYLAIARARIEFELVQQYQPALIA